MLQPGDDPYCRGRLPGGGGQVPVPEAGQLHIEYVLDRMRDNTTYVRNIKKYLLAALYNAPATIGSYYTSLVSHDLYGGGERR